MNEYERERIRAIARELETISESQEGGRRARLVLVGGEDDKPVYLRLVANQQGYIEFACELLNAMSSDKTDS